LSGVRGMRHGQGLPDDELEPCGTLAAYRRHLCRGDPVDRDCQQAAARDWQDRVAAGWKRPPRPYRARTHLAAAGGAAECGPRRTAAAVTGDLGEVTCKRCLAVRGRHLADARAIERRRSRAA
jgi:hypothetical protein